MGIEGDRANPIVARGITLRGAASKRALALAAAIVLAVLAFMLLPEYVDLYWSRVPKEFQQHLAYLYLDALLIGYAAAPVVAASLIAAAILIRALAKPDTPPAGEPTHCRRIEVRLLAAGTAIVLGLVILDIGAAAWSAWQRRAPRPPALSAAREGEDPPPAPALPGLPSPARARGAAAPLRLLVIGESSGRGEPYHPWLSVGQIVAWRLESVFPGRRIQVDIWATGGATLRQMHMKLEKLTERPDALIVYVGHNEYASRYPWMRETEAYYDDDTPSLYSPAALLAVLRISPFCRLVLETWDHRRVELRPPRLVTREPVDRPVCTAEESAAIAQEFRDRLESIASYCEQIGTLPVFIIPASNDAGYDPSRSVLEPQTPRDERLEVAREIRRARALEKDDPAEAMRLVRDLLSRHPELAEAHYRLARMLERAGDRAGALPHYLIARERDGLPLRCPEALRDVYRAVAARHPAVVLVDGPKVLAAAAGDGILDDRFFHDAQHPNVRGYAALAQDLLDQLASRRAFGWPEGARPSPVDANECIRQFGIDSDRWAEVCRREANFFDVTAYIRYDPAFRLERAAEYRRAEKALESGRSPTEGGIPGWSARPIPAPVSQAAASAR